LAVASARAAFPTWSLTSRDERIALFERIVVEYQRRYEDIASAITEEMGVPCALARQMQAFSGLAHLQAAAEVLKTYKFKEDRGTTTIIKEPIGVCALITPWNWPVNQIAAKVAPALAVGCTVVLKPSELALFSAIVFAEILDSAGVPAGVFNLVNGDGRHGAQHAYQCRHGLVYRIDPRRDRSREECGRYSQASHPGTRREEPQHHHGGRRFGHRGRCRSERGDAQSGQSCNAPTRMLVPADEMDEVATIARQVVAAVTVGDPAGDFTIGPVVSKAQWDNIQRLIASGIAEGATLVSGGEGRPDGLDQGYYVKPTVFANVTNDMTIAREEIFGPVLSIIGYDSLDQAVQIANNTEYGLAAYVWGADLAEARAVASRLRAGQVALNGGSFDIMAPFGGYKRSGNGREWGDHGFAEYLETKAVIGSATGVAAA